MILNSANGKYLKMTLKCTNEYCKKGVRRGKVKAEEEYINNLLQNRNHSFR